MRCREAMATAYDLLDERQPMDSSPELSKHLAQCQRCADEIGQLTALSGLVAQRRAKPEIRTDAIKQRVMAEIIVERDRRERPKFALSPALSAALGSAAVISVFVIGIFVGRGGMDPSQPTAGPAPSVATGAAMVGSAMEAAVGPTTNITAPVIAAGSGNEEPLTAEPILEDESQTIAEPQSRRAGASPRASNRRATDTPIYKSRPASDREPVVPRGDSVRSPDERVEYSTSQSPTVPDDGPRVRSYEMEFPELQMPVPSSPHGSIGSQGSAERDTRINVVVPGQEF